MREQLKSLSLLSKEEQNKIKKSEYHHDLKTVRTQDFSLNEKDLGQLCTDGLIIKSQKNESTYTKYLSDIIYS